MTLELDEYYKKYLKFNEVSDSKIAGLTAPHKLKLVEKFFVNSDLREKEIKIVDLGGVDGSFHFLKKLFPNSTIYSVNIVKEQITKCENQILEDISKKLSFEDGSIDFVFFGDVLEHLIDPDFTLREIKRILKTQGLLILTTPNLAHIYNRVGLLFGFAPTNYHPSEIRFGSISGEKHASYHKSVFTFKALKIFLSYHGFDTLKTQGYSYQYSGPAHLLSKILPTSLQEGTLVIAIKK
jgi:SAM-dependent methyltransferase